MRRPAPVLCLAGDGGPGACSFFACPGGVLASPESFFACPGGVFASPDDAIAAGGWRTAAAGWVGGGDGFSGTVTAGGAGGETEARFGRPAPVACVGCRAIGVTATAGVPAVTRGSEVVRCEMWCPVCGMVGA